MEIHYWVLDIQCFQDKRNIEYPLRNIEFPMSPDLHFARISQFIAESQTCPERMQVPNFSNPLHINLLELPEQFYLPLQTAVTIEASA